MVDNQILNDTRSYSMTIPTKEHKKNQEKDEIIKQMKKKKKLIF